MSRFSEWIAGRTSRGRVIFTGTRRRMTSVTVRGDQMAQEMGGICLRHRYLSTTAVASSPAVIWVVEADLEQVARFSALTPQVMDVINPAYEGDRDRFEPQYRTFQNFILNTDSSRYYLGPDEREWRRFQVIPHHHCNASGWQLPEERLARPRVVGYVGQPEHLHDADAIQRAVESLGLTFLMLPTDDLEGYRRIDIGIAWTQRDAQRDQTRSNIKLANFAAHGIPSVVCEYESYRDVERTVGECAVICETLDSFIEGVREVAANEPLRHTFASRGKAAYEAYSRPAIAQRYWTAIEYFRQS